MWQRLQRVPLRYWHLTILSAFALAIAAVALQAGQTDHRRHERLIDGIRKLEQLDRAVVEEVLRIRVGDVHNFDRLSGAILEAGRRLEQLDAELGPETLSAAALEAGLAEYGRLHGERRRLVDDFKSEFAVLRNALAAIPVLLPRLAAELQFSLGRPDLAASLKSLATSVALQRLTSGRSEHGQEIAQAQWITGEAAKLPASTASRLNALLSHSRLALDRGDAVEGLLERILSLPTSEANAALRQGYARIHNPVQDQARFHRSVFMLIGGLFAAYVAFFVVRLQRARNDLSAGNAALEEAKRQAQEAQAQLLEAVEAMEEGFALFDADDRLILCNSAYRRLHPHLDHVIQPGQRFEDLVRTNVYSGLVPDAVRQEEEWIAERMRRWREGGPADAVFQQAGRWLMHRDWRTPSGKTVGIRADVTALKEREAELAEAKEKAVLADRAKSEFLANMSHEIRTPMNGIMGMTQLLAMTGLDPKQKMYADVIVKSGNALVTIINDILDFSKIEAGGLELDPQPFALAEAVEDVATLFSTRAEEKGLELIVRIAPGLPEKLIGDVGRLRQIVANLVGNAVKFTESGHVLLDVSGKLTDGAADLLVKVVDTGIGIPPGMVETIFDRFSQVDGSSSRKHDGTGLGLAVCKRLVERMGGEIGVDSTPAEGSAFWFTLRLPVDGEAAANRDLSGAVAGARILVVDDDEASRTTLLEQLAAWQFRAEAVACGEDGVAALRQAARQGRPFELVILDHDPPAMNGAEAARGVRGEPTVAATPIVMLTSADRPRDGGHVPEIAVEAKLVKPVRFAVLLETLVAVLHEVRHGKAAPQQSRSAGSG